NYTEKDIQEAARAFTGWHHDPEVTHFEYNEGLHDTGPKTILKKTGNFGGEDVIRILTAEEACAKFLVGKLYAYLVSETPPPDGLLELLEEQLRESDYDIADLVKAVRGSRRFFSAHAFRKRVDLPVVYSVGV